MTVEEMMTYIKDNCIDINFAMFNDDIGFMFLPTKGIPMRRGDEMLMKVEWPNIGPKKYCELPLDKERNGEKFFKLAVKYPKKVLTMLVCFEDSITGLYSYGDTEDERYEGLYDLLAKCFIEYAEIDSVEKLEKIMGRAEELHDEERHHRHAEWMGIA